LPLAIVVEPGPELRARGCEVWNVSAAEIDELHRQLGRIIAEPPLPLIHIPVDDADVLADGRVNRDLLVDAMVRAALTALTQLYRGHAGPPPSRWHDLPGGARAAETD
jgi:hypothetical protein